METIPETSISDVSEEQVPAGGLFVVWFDTYCGYKEAPDWWWEDPGPQPLSAALDQAAWMRLEGWICVVVPENQNPRPDGRWDNP